jgi:hypothetical protein
MGHVRRLPDTAMNIIVTYNLLKDAYSGICPGTRLLVQSGMTIFISSLKKVGV